MLATAACPVYQAITGQDLYDSPCIKSHLQRNEGLATLQSSKNGFDNLPDLIDVRRIHEPRAGSSSPT